MLAENGIYRVIRDDHEEAKRIVDELASTSTDDAGRREELTPRLRRQMVVHYELEQRILYAPLLEHETTRRLALEREEEHKIAQRLLVELDQMNKTTERWGAKFAVFRDILASHVAHEEERLFPKATEVLDAAHAGELGERFTEERRRRLAD